MIILILIKLKRSTSLLVDISYSPLNRPGKNPGGIFIFWLNNYLIITPSLPAGERFHSKFLTFLIHGRHVTSESLPGKRLRRLTGGLLVSIVSLWLAIFEGWPGRQTNFRGSLNLHWVTRGMPGRKREKCRVMNVSNNLMHKISVEVWVTTYPSIKVCCLPIFSGITEVTAHYYHNSRFYIIVKKQKAMSGITVSYINI